MAEQSIYDIKSREFRFRTPLREEDVVQLRMGDIVYLDGCIFTGRELVYKQLLEVGKEPPVDIAGNCNVQIHCSPCGREVSPGNYVISAMQSTASFRYYDFVPPFIEKFGMRAIIGKSGMHQEVYEHFKKNKCVYLLVIGYGLLSAAYAKCVREVKGVYWQKEVGGIAEAMWVMDVEKFGPLIVECDTDGNSLYTLANREISPKIADLLSRYPRPWLKRHGEVQIPDEEVTRL